MLISQDDADTKMSAEIRRLSNPVKRVRIRIKCHCNPLSCDFRFPPICLIEIVILPIMSFTEIVHPHIGRVRGLQRSNDLVQFLGIQYATLKDRFARGVLCDYADAPDALLDATKIGSVRFLIYHTMMVGSEMCH